MKLKDYFKQQQEHGLSDIQKLDMYQNIMLKQMKSSYQKKRSFLHVKSFVYASFFIFMLLGFYGVYFFQQQTGDLDVITLNNGGNVAQADYIAKVVDFQGTFYIENQGKLLQTSNINDGDTILLKDKAQIIFHINSGTKAKIVGPAKLTLFKDGEKNYKLQLIYGDYMEMQSLDTKPHHQVKVSVDGIEVIQKDTSKPLDFQVIKEGQSHVIANKGSDLVVTTEGEKATTTNLNNKQVIAINNNDIAVFDSFEKFSKAVQTKNISQIFTFDSLQEENTTVSEASSGEIEVAKTTASETSKANQEISFDELLSLGEEAEEILEVPEIAKSLSVNVSQEKNVINEDQINLLNSTFQTEFLFNDLKSLCIAYVQGDQTETTNLTQSINKKLQKTFNIFGLEYTYSNTSFEQQAQTISASLLHLSNVLDSNYLLPPKYLSSIQKTNSWINFISRQNQGSMSGMERSQIQSQLQLPSGLSF